MIMVKRAYEKATSKDGVRILVDRVWPRGVTKEALHADLWLKEVTPSTALRKWFSHDPAKWTEFQHKYFAELNANKSACAPILQAAKSKPVTLVYSARDSEHNNAVALQRYLKQKHKLT